jgi:CubicO group peptidase (beta-lactamase class C family)
MLENMSHNWKHTCRKCSLVATSLLLLQFGFAQGRFDKVDDWLKDNLHQLGGRATLVILKDCKILYNKSKNDLSPGQKMAIRYFARRQGKDVNEALHDYSFTTKAPIASSSKWLSAALVMTFVDEGKLNPEDTIGKYLPVFTRHQKGNITILECLSHLTGINGGDLKESRQIITGSNTMNEAIEKIAELPMEGTPGKVFHYSSIGLQIAAAVIEKISGKDFKTLFDERIAIPCEMKNTNFGKDKVPLAAGGAYSTPEDYIHFLQMILQNGTYKGNKVLSKKSVYMMEQNYTRGIRVAYSPPQAEKMNYGLGEWIMEDESQRERANAVTCPGLFGSFPWIDNTRNYAGFLFVVNLKQNNRYEMYTNLKAIVDKAIHNTDH